jgi:4'-phosphopantetheinyl transferase
MYLFIRVNLQSKLRMPLLRINNSEHATVAVWKTEEDAAFFMQSFSNDVLKEMNLQRFTNESKQIEQLSSRYLLQTVIGSESMQSFRKAENGKPYLETNAQHISISHTKNHSAIIVSKAGACGIDIEAIHPRVKKVAHKFIRADEASLISEANEVERMMLLWSAKETVYKVYANKEVDFKEHILLTDLQFTSEYTGRLKGKLEKDSELLEMEIAFEFFDGHVMTFATL